MTTTITIENETRDRLTDYKHGDMTYDDLLNLLMDKVPLEDVSAEHIQEHYRRLETFKGLSKEDLKKRLSKRINRGS